jgi:hypothetical protein
LRIRRGRGGRLAQLRWRHRPWGSWRATRSESRPEARAILLRAIRASYFARRNRMKPNELALRLAFLSPSSKSVEAVAYFWACRNCRAQAQGVRGSSACRARRSDPISRQFPLGQSVSEPRRRWGESCRVMNEPTREGSVTLPAALWRAGAKRSSVRPRSKSSWVTLRSVVASTPGRLPGGNWRGPVHRGQSIAVAACWMAVGKTVEQVGFASRSTHALSTQGLVIGLPSFRG